jgi:hypothetical protein
VADFDKAIAPGQEGKITLKLDTSNRHNKLTKSATVTSNDPHTPITSISLSCFVKEHISIKPGRQIKLEGYEGDRLSQKVTITATAGQEFEITEVKPDPDLAGKITCKIETIQKGKEYSLEVASISKEEGVIRGRLELRTTSKLKPFIVFAVFINIRAQ